MKRQLWLLAVVLSGCTTLSQRITRAAEDADEAALETLIAEVNAEAVMTPSVRDSLLVAFNPRNEKSMYSIAKNLSVEHLSDFRALDVAVERCVATAPTNACPAVLRALVYRGVEVHDPVHAGALCLSENEAVSAVGQKRQGAISTQFRGGQRVFDESDGNGTAVKFVRACRADSGTDQAVVVSLSDSTRRVVPLHSLSAAHMPRDSAPLADQSGRSFSPLAVAKREAGVQ